MSSGGIKNTMNGYGYHIVLEVSSKQCRASGLNGRSTCIPTCKPVYHIKAYRAGYQTFEFFKF